MDQPSDRTSDGVISRSKLGAYVHFPYCLSKCPYCDFFSVPEPDRTRIPHAAYADRVLAELEVRLAHFDGLLPKLDSLFFGGGTPSLWQTSELGRVIAAVTGAFGTSASAVELTVECNPSSFSRDKAEALRAVGVNRVSLGVQSLDRPSLEFLGRRHDAGGALSALEAAFAGGFSRVSADYIFGVAGRGVVDELAQLERLLQFPLEHLSVYALTIEPGTRFGSLAKAGRLPIAPEDGVADSFMAIHERLEAAGFEHYEISNYARPGARSRHNVGYWRGRNYLGLGTAAVGTVAWQGSRLRYKNTLSVARYLETSFAPGNALFEAAPAGLLAESEIVSPEMALAERFMLGLRMSDGVNLDSVEAELGLLVRTPKRLRSLERLKSRGRLSWDGTTVRLAPESWLLADGTIAELL